MSENPWHKFLLKHRRYCERCANGTSMSTQVRKFNGKDTALCDKHAGRLDAVRLSDEKQLNPIQ